MSISFNSVPTNLRVPGVYAEFDSSRAIQGLYSLAYRGLLVGQKISSGTATALTPVRVTNAEAAKTLFGSGSQLAQMVAAWLENDSLTEVYAVPLADDGSAQAATGTITFAGTATEAGTVEVYIGGRNADAAVASGDEAADVASAVAAAINAEADICVTASAASAVITLTAKNKGAAANGVDVRVSHYSDEALPAGITATIAVMSGGTGDPDLDDLVAALGDTWYHVLAMPYTSSAALSAMKDELEDRDGPLRMIDGHLFTAAAGTHAELGTLGDTHNSPYVTIVHMHGVPTTPWEMVAATAAVASYYGQIDPARPFQTLKLSGIMAPQEADRFTLQENNLLLYDGVSTFYVDADDGVRIQRLITTYKTNAAGADDTSYLDVNTRLTLMYLRYDIRQLFLNKYPRHKLADDGTRFGAGQAVITPKIGKAECVARFRKWETNGLAEDADSFKEALVVERNGTDPNRLDFLLPPDLVNQFRVGAFQIQFNL